MILLSMTFLKAVVTAAGRTRERLVPFDLQRLKAETDFQPIQNCTGPVRWIQILAPYRACFLPFGTFYGKLRGLRPRFLLSPTATV